MIPSAQLLFFSMLVSGVDVISLPPPPLQPYRMTDVTAFQETRLERDECETCIPNVVVFNAGGKAVGSLLIIKDL